MTCQPSFIATRAAIRAGAPSIRDAALGVVHPKCQTVFHHVHALAHRALTGGAPSSALLGIGGKPRR